ncbi:MAG: DUF2207 domain-containing protein [Candidatus Paceibacterota bacterium]|jgi:uncharacterized membrane protein
MKRLFYILAAFAVLFPSSFAFASDDWKIPSMASAIIIQEDGLVRITETIVADFGTVPKHGIYRYIPVGYRASDGKTLAIKVTVNSVTDGEKPLSYTTAYTGGNMSLKIGDPNKTFSGKQTYVLDYTVRGILRAFPNYDELYWNVTGNKWGVAIERASATVSLPKEGIVQMSCYAGGNGTNNYCESKKSSENTANFSWSKPLQKGEEMTIALGFASKMVPLLPPLAEDVPPTNNAATFSALAFLLSFAGTLIFCIAALSRLWQKKGRDATSSGETAPLFGKKTIIAEYESPLGLRPGEIGALIDETADTVDITATIIDLASRGFLTIEEIPKKWFLGNTDYALTKTSLANEKLLAYEKTLLQALFKDRKSASLSSFFQILANDQNPSLQKKEESVKISDLKNSFYKDLVEIKKELYLAVSEKNLFEENPQTARMKYMGFALAMTVAGLILSTLTGPLQGGAFSGMGLGLIFSGVLFFIVAQRAMPKKTPLGYETYLKAEGYKLFISETEKHRAVFYEKQNMFMDVLPYAIVFGVTKKLADAMKDTGMKASEPSWYHGTAPFNAALFATNMGDLSKSIGAAMASAPGGSGSGGGGFSGGGFGGGGGGSW